MPFHRFAKIYIILLKQRSCSAAVMMIEQWRQQYNTSVLINSAVKRRFQHGIWSWHCYRGTCTRGYNISVQNSQKFGGHAYNTVVVVVPIVVCTENITDEIHDGHGAIIIRIHTIKINNNCCHYRGNMNAYIPLTAVDYNANAVRGGQNGLMIGFWSGGKIAIISLMNH